MIDKADTYCGKCIKADVCGMEGVYDPATTYCAYRVESRPHGEWVFDKDGYFSCSCCKMKPHYQVATTYYCPNCGADMREGDKNG